MNNNEETLKQYDKIVEEYALMNKHNETVSNQRDFFTSLLNGNLILDVGSGIGRDTESFREQGFEATGIDGSLSMLNKAAELYPESNFVHFNLLKDNYSKLRSYDGIWCCASLLHFTPEEMKSTLEKLLNHLKEDGVIYLSVKTDLEMYEKSADGRWFQIYTKEYLDNLFNSLNLIVIRYEENLSVKSETFSSYFLKKK